MFYGNNYLSLILFPLEIILKWQSQNFIQCFREQRHHFYGCYKRQKYISMVQFILHIDTIFQPSKTWPWIWDCIPFMYICFLLCWGTIAGELFTHPFAVWILRIFYSVQSIKPADLVHQTQIFSYFLPWATTLFEANVTSPDWGDKWCYRSLRQEKMIFLSIMVLSISL